MSLCNISDFSEYPYSFPNDTNLNTSLKQAIAYHEKRLLRKLFAPDYIVAYNLLDDENLDELLKECLIPYTYFHFVQSLDTKVTTNGIQTNILEITKSANDDKTFVDVHNDHIDKLKDVLIYLDKNKILHNSLKPEYINVFGI